MYPLRFCVCFFLVLAASTVQLRSENSSAPKPRKAEAATAELPAAQAIAFPRLSHPDVMRTYGDASPPIGYVGFCQREPQECKVKNSSLSRMNLTQERWDELNSINTLVNTMIAPASDEELYGQVEYWTIPVTKGDCEDYVLLKRKKLIDLGWPESDLLITVVRDERGDGHAVLTVRTNKGDFILDNKESRILPPSLTPYDYIKRQAFQDPMSWVSLTPAPSSVAGSAAARTAH